MVYEHPGDGTPYGVLTGDTLFVGDVGRPDLLASSGTGFDAETLARLLFQSLHQQILDLPDETRVFPAHGAGSTHPSAFCAEGWEAKMQRRVPRDLNFGTNPTAKTLLRLGNHPRSLRLHIHRVDLGPIALLHHPPPQFHARGKHPILRRKFFRH